MTLKTMRLILLIGMLAAAWSNDLPLQIHTKRAIDSSIANVHVKGNKFLDGVLTYTYGSCHSDSSNDRYQHITSLDSHGHDRLIWIIPDGSQPTGCISAWRSTQFLVGRSAPLEISNRRQLAKREVPPVHNSSKISADGPWFDGVALLRSTNMSAVDASTAKSKEIAIIGAGISGLTTWLCLNQAGMQNIHLVESSSRLGGRIRTAYFGDPSERLYQEMGPMRIPKSITDTETNKTIDLQDHKLFFDLVTELNKINNGNKSLSIELIKWYQSSPNSLQCQDGIRKPDKRCPNLAEVAANASWAAPEVGLDEETQELTDYIMNTVFTPERMREVATNTFKAFQHWTDSGLNGVPGDGWSEFAYMHNYLKYSLNATDQVLNNLLAGASTGNMPFWDRIFEGAYFSAGTWATIDGGLNRLPSAFQPLVGEATFFNRKVTRLAYDEESKKVSLFWKENYTQPYQNASYDFAITTVPFPVMRRWELPKFSAVKTSGILNYHYDSVCKVALKFQTRFWEHFEQPIMGSCSAARIDIPGIGTICYPSYDINSSGPGVMLASYTGADDGLRWVSSSEEEHVQYVVDAMADIHGDVVYEQYTGEYKRLCWLQDPHSTVSWAAATVAQRKLYMPSFFETEKGVIIGGEGSSFTSSWMSSGIESGIRSSVQLLLELGLVDEAKATVEKWMARWISV